MHKIIEQHFAAYNLFDTDAIMATYAPDALVYDVNREFWGTDAIRAWVAKEIVGDRVTVEVTEVREHHGTTIVRGRYDGTYDKSKLPPGDLILTSYVRVRDDKIVEMYIVRVV
jgi:ketosteroid isomerase-like protein